MPKKNSGFADSILEYSNTYWIVNVMELLEGWHTTAYDLLLPIHGTTART